MAAAKPLDPQALLSRLKAGKLDPVYLLAGPDGFRAERTARWLRGNVVDEAMADFNVEVLQADEKGPAAIVEAAQAFPMFGGRRFLWVKHAEALPSGSALDPLLNYLEAPSPSTILCFTSSKLDKRLKFTTACADAGVVVDFSPLAGVALLQQVERQAQAHGIGFAPGTAALLVDLVGDDLAEIDGELAKLGLYLDEGHGPLAPDELRELVGRSRDVDAFALADQLDAAAPTEALRSWFGLRARGGDVYGASAILGWRLRQLAQLREAVDAGLGPREAAAALGMGSWQLDRLKPLVRGSDAASVDASLEAFRRADRRAKSSSLGAGLAWDLALLEWALSGPAGRSSGN